MIPRLPPRRAPVWFELALVALVAGAAHALGLHALEAPPVFLGWFFFLATLASWIWRGLEVLGRITLQALQYSVHLLWKFAREISDGLKGFGGQFLVGMKHAWGFLRATYTHVLRPAWLKFWRFVDWARELLERVLRPVLDVLTLLRRELLEWYTTFVRPVLDALGLARRIVQLFARLGLEWAQALDAKLAEIEDWIGTQIGRVLGELNKVINLVNRVVTADGLFQRLALIRSIERDMVYVSRAFYRLTTRRTTEAERAAALAPLEGRTPAEHADELGRALQTRDGPIAYKGNEFAADLALLLRRGRGG